MRGGGQNRIGDKIVFVAEIVVAFGQNFAGRDRNGLGASWLRTCRWRVVSRVDIAVDVAVAVASVDNDAAVRRTGFLGRSR